MRDIIRKILSMWHLHYLDIPDETSELLAFLNIDNEIL